ncbi:MAG: glycosyltransferase family 39 protein [Candidatus Omnitrophica bacterium]|nr:glycosyltransferase family 39 protein [Candidatus Omnitrophota bacterium]
MENKTTTKFLFVLLLALSCVLIFKNLSNNYLWQDEGESAALARNIVKFGYPRSFDGINFITPNIPSGFGNSYQWKFHPWLHFYAVALSYVILGESTFSSRFPFAITGLMSIVIVFFLAKRIFRKDGVALLSVLFASTSIPFILHMRQCRYYGLQAFLVLAVIYIYLNVLQKKAKYLWLLGALLTALYYTNHGTFVPVFGAIFIHFFWLNKERALWKKFIFMCVAVILLALPWAIYSSISPQYLAILKFAVLKKNFGFQIRVLNKYIFPLFFFIILYVFSSIKNKAWKFHVDKDDKPGLKFILLFIAVNICFYTIVEQRTIRYYVHLFPFLYILQAWIFVRFFSKQKILGSALAALFIFTNIAHNSLPYLIEAGLPSKSHEERKELLKEVDFYLLEYIYEITHDYNGPVEGTVRFLKQHAKPGDTVKIAYSDASLIFYLPYLKIENDHFFNDKDFPEWIVWRDYWINEYKSYYEDYKFQGYKLYDENYIREIKARYIAHEIPYPDIIWENRPDDLEYHKFRTVKGVKNVIIYERAE